MLIAQTLWVFGYAALPAFFVLYAERSLGLGVGAAGALPLAFGVLTALGIVLAGRAPAERVHSLLVTGAVLLGAGLLAAAPATSLAAAALPFAVAAVGAGIVTALGFPYFARFVPEGQAGRYSGVFFAGRSVASAAALPLAGLAVELTGSYRAVLWFGAVALVAAVPLVAAQRRAPGSAQRRATDAASAAGERRRRDPRVRLRPRGRGGDEPRSSYVDQIVLVDDGAPPAISRSLDVLADDDRVRVLRLGSNGGKGSAVAAGACPAAQTRRHRRRSSCSTQTASTSPRASRRSSRRADSADVVIGHRRERRSMPLIRRIGNRAASVALFASTRAWVPDTQNGMRLFRREALTELPLPEGGYDAESRHLRGARQVRPQVSSRSRSRRSTTASRATTGP